MTTQLPLLAPSILAADYTRLGEQINACTEAGTEWLHCDIMDGHFVPNISYGPDIVKAAGRAGGAFLDVHLMIENPDRYVRTFVDAGADLLCVHQEACPHLHRSIQNIRQHGIKAGVAVNPATSLTNLEPILEFVDLVLLMSVNPGFGGQSFIESTYDRLRKLCAMREEKGVDFLIEVDGGVGPGNIEKISSCGADVLVAGSSVFKRGDIGENIKELSRLAGKGRGTLA